MSEMVGRAAAAMFAVDWPNAKNGWDVHADDQGLTFSRYTNLARAAIEAMREPTGAMIDAHTGRSRSSIIGTGSHFTDEALNAWNAMIDAALK